MWIISNNEKQLLYRVTPNKQHIVSRKGGDLILDDQSVSRKHAQLYIKSEGREESLVVIDFSSKYGTFVIVGEKITRVPPNEPFVIHDGDNVRFGIQTQIWSVKNTPLLVTTSKLSNEEKNELKDIIYSLAGKVVESWQMDCTHLTMSGLELTVKTVCALAQACPIVTLEYWRSITDRLNKMQGPYPDVKDFLPPLKETTLINKNDISFLPNLDRKKLFSGMTFVAATSRQLKRIKSMVVAAGGRAVEIGTEDVNLFDEGTVLMQHSANDNLASQPSQLSVTYLEAEKNIKARNLRCIPESDIGLSVVFCSVSHYCNPKFSLHQILLHKHPAQPTQNSTIISETQEEPVCDRKTQCIEVPESCPLSEDFQKSETPVTKKRNREDERDNVEGSSKKLCSSSVSQNDLFLSEPNQSTPSVNSSVHSDSKNPLKMGIGRRKNKVVDNDDPFAFPSDLIKHQPSKQTDEDMFISPTDKPKQAASTSKAETKIQSPSGDMFSFVSPLNNKGQATRKSSIDMFALSGQSTKRRREENTNLSRLHFDDDIDMGKQQKNPDSSDGCFINQQERLNRPKIHKKVKLDENDPFAFPNQMGRSTSDAVGDVFDFPVNVAINNSKSDSQFDTESKEMSFSKCKRGICMSQMNSSLDGPRICPEQQQKDGNKLVSESSVKQEQEDEINMNMRTSQNIEFKRLTVPKQAASKREGLEQKANCKNFKKFRKVFPLNRSIVPQIIGGSDLYVYEAPIKVKVEDWLNEVPNEAEDIEDW